MSYPKEKCGLASCIFCKVDTLYDGTVCSYVGDFDEAIADSRIPEGCPWIYE